MNWKDFWDHQATQFGYLKGNGRIAEGREVSSERMDRELEYIEEVFLKRFPGTILDVCCGNGLFASRLASKGYKVVGVDFSSQQIAQAKQAYPNDTDLTFVQGDARALGNHLTLLEKRPYSCALLLFAFQYFEEYTMGKQVIEEVFKLTKGPLLITDIPDRSRFFHFYNTPGKVLRYLRDRLLGKETMGKFWSEAELLQIGKELGLSCHQVENTVSSYNHYRFSWVFTKDY